MLNFTLFDIIMIIITSLTKELSLLTYFYEVPQQVTLVIIVRIEIPRIQQKQLFKGVQGSHVVSGSKTRRSAIVPASPACTVYFNRIGLKKI